MAIKQTTTETANMNAIKVHEYVSALRRNSLTEGVFDSAASVDFVKSQATSAYGTVVPEELQHVYDQVDEKAQSSINKALLDGVDAYRAQHGMECPADLIQLAIHNAYSATPEGQKAATGTFDSASNVHADNLSLQPNRAVIAILTTLTEGIPIAHYLPADIRSNEARLAILSHQAGSTFGGYAEKDGLDGVSSGEAYISSSRVHTVKPSDTGDITGKVTKIQDTRTTCDQEAGDLKLMRGRTLVYVQGRVVAGESNSTGSGNSPVAGSFKVAGTAYTLSGNINTDTGEFSFTTTPALPATVPVTVEGFIDFERAPELTPTIRTEVEVFKLYANPWRVLTRISPDARTQISSELGLDPYSESIMAIQAQFANERHYKVLSMGLALGANNTETFDFAAAKAHQDSSLPDVWRDFATPLNVVSQRMAEMTIDHGVTHLYVTKTVAAMLAGLPTTFFEPSGVTARPGIYRLGRLFGRYEVYYTPKILQETETGGKITAQILCAGRATDVARNPIVLGDAVSPTVIPLLAGNDLRQGAGFYARNFTCVNPHEPSSNGFGVIEVTNI